MVNKNKKKVVVDADSLPIQEKAIKMIFVNHVVLNVCDELAKTKLYKQDLKMLINQLTHKLEDYTKRFYSYLSDEEELQYYHMLDAQQKAADLFSTLSLDETVFLTEQLEAYRQECKQIETHNAEDTAAISS